VTKKSGEILFGVECPGGNKNLRETHTKGKVGEGAVAIVEASSSQIPGKNENKKKAGEKDGLVKGKIFLNLLVGDEGESSSGILP